MAIPSITGVGRVSVTNAETPSTTVVEARQPPRIPVEIDQITQQPLPPRFPWLSRLSHQLESASGQRPAFTPAPMLGDHVDQQV